MFKMSKRIFIVFIVMGVFVLIGSVVFVDMFEDFYKEEVKIYVVVVKF